MDGTVINQTQFFTEFYMLDLVGASAVLLMNRSVSLILKCSDSGGRGGAWMDKPMSQR